MNMRKQYTVKPSRRAMNIGMRLLDPIVRLRPGANVRGWVEAMCHEIDSTSRAVQTQAFRSRFQRSMTILALPSGLSRPAPSLTLAQAQAMTASLDRPLAAD
jgi:hypothetical protein